jgi:hypothetical protein
MSGILRIVLILISITTVIPANAAVIDVTLQIGGYYDADDFSPLPPPWQGLPCCDPVVVQVDVYMAVLSLDPGEDSFGSAEFSIKPKNQFGSQVVPDLDAGGWAALPRISDTNGNAPGGIMPSFAINADLGSDSQDYVDILVRMADGAFTNPADPRRNIGEPGSPYGYPMQIGSGFFEWNNFGLPPTFELEGLVVMAKTTTGQFVPARTVPEPGTLALASMGLFPLVLRRRNG